MIGTLSQVAGHATGANLAASGTGTQYLLISDANQHNLDITGKLTMAVWVKLSTLNAIQIVMSKWSDTGSQYQYLIYVGSDNKVVCQIYSGSNTYTATSAATLDTNWHHICVIYNQTDIRIYIDNSQSGTPTSYTGSIATGTAYFELFNYASNNSYVLQGALDDACIWSRAISTGELSTLYSIGDDFGETAHITGTVKDKNGTAINCSTYNARANVYSKNNSSNAPTVSQSITSADGTYSLDGLASGTKYLVTYEIPGSYAVTGDVNIAAAEFRTAA
jgi:hypothetical protein